MRHKVLLVLFLLGTLQSLCVAQIATRSIVQKLTSDSTLSDKREERIVQLKKLFQSVPDDSAARKVVSLDSLFREKYLNDNDFIYNQEEGGKSFFKRLIEKIGLLLQKMFGIGTFKSYSDVTALIFKILCGLVVLVVLYFLIRLLMIHKGKWIFSKKNESILIDINNTEQLIQSADFEQLISETERQGDTRQSIRLYYLWLLKDLKDHDLIVWLPEKTNADYQYELKDDMLKKRFSTLSYLFNYIWYGGFDIVDDDYLTARKAFLSYLKGDHHNG